MRSAWYVSRAVRRCPLTTAASSRGSRVLTPDGQTIRPTVVDGAATPDVPAKKSLKQVADLPGRRERNRSGSGPRSRCTRRRDCLAEVAQAWVRRRPGAAVTDPGRVHRGLLPLPLLHAQGMPAHFLVDPPVSSSAPSAHLDQFRYGWTTPSAEDDAEAPLRHLPRGRVGDRPRPDGQRQPQPSDRVKVETKTPDRGPLLILDAGAEDPTVPWAIAQRCPCKRRGAPASGTEVEADRPTARPLLTIDARLDDGDVDARQRRSPASISPVRTPAGDHHRMLGHRPRRRGATDADDPRRQPGRRPGRAASRRRACRGRPGSSGRGSSGPTRGTSS